MQMYGYLEKFNFICDRISAASVSNIDSRAQFTSGLSGLEFLWLIDKFTRLALYSSTYGAIVVKWRANYMDKNIWYYHIVLLLGQHVVNAEEAVFILW